jgi:hypothetical protein
MRRDVSQHYLTPPVQTSDRSMIEGIGLRARVSKLHNSLNEISTPGSPAWLCMRTNAVPRPLSAADWLRLAMDGQTFHHMSPHVSDVFGEFEDKLTLSRRCSCATTSG